MLEKVIEYLNDKTIEYGCFVVKNIETSLNFEDVEIRFVAKYPIPTIEVRFRWSDDGSIIKAWEITQDDIQQIIYEPPKVDGGYASIIINLYNGIKLVFNISE